MKAVLAARARRHTALRWSRVRLLCGTMPFLLTTRLHLPSPAGKEAPEWVTDEEKPVCAVLGVISSSTASQFGLCRIGHLLRKMRGPPPLARGGKGIVRTTRLRVINRGCPYGDQTKRHCRGDHWSPVGGTTPFFANNAATRFSRLPLWWARRVKKICRWHIFSPSGKQAMLATRAEGWRGATEGECATMR